MIYLLHVPSLDICKVGFTSGKVENRIAAGAAFIPGKHVIAAEREGGRPLEAAIHRAASKYLVHGEWFSPLRHVRPIFFETEALPHDKLVSAVHPRLGLACDIRYERHRAGLTQTQIAEALGVNQSTIARWEESPDLMKPFVADAVQRAIKDAPSPAD